MPDPDPNPFADCDTIVCYGNAKPTDTHTASVINCIDGEIIGRLEPCSMAVSILRTAKEGESGPMVWSEPRCLQSTMSRA